MSTSFAPVLLLSIAIAAVTAGCDAKRESSRQRRDPGALVVAQAADVIALDPVRATDSESIEVGELLFEGLVGWKPGTTEIEPRLATQWVVSEDGLRWTFNLRSHVRFHDGRQTALTRLAEKGQPDWVIQAQMGHVSPAMMRSKSLSIMPFLW